MWYIKKIDNIFVRIRESGFRIRDYKKERMVKINKN